MFKNKAQQCHRHLLSRKLSRSRACSDPIIRVIGQQQREDLNRIKSSKAGLKLASGCRSDSTLAINMSLKCGATLVHDDTYLNSDGMGQFPMRERPIPFWFGPLEVKNLISRQRQSEHLAEPECNPLILTHCGEGYGGGGDPSATVISQGPLDHVGEKIPLLYLVNNGLTLRTTIPASEVNIPGNCLQLQEASPTSLFHFPPLGISRTGPKNLADLSGDRDGVNVSLLVPLVRKAELSRSEVQILIDLLLNKQQGPNDEHSEWYEGRQDPVVKLKKQLAEKEKALAEEQEAAQAVQSKLRELRSELNSERSRLTQMCRQLEEGLTAKTSEVQTLITRLQLATEAASAEKQALVQQGQQEQQVTSIV
uniref:Uncharacterized protein n=1 Tax=Timema douglasi TaxID=61478 RepID=A0A7R8VIH3_TIMDO|nr:unnamed protein product [Timema douglasi]